MPKDIIKLGLKNIVGIPLLQTQTQLITNVPNTASRSILNTGVAVQATGLLYENIKKTQRNNPWAICHTQGLKGKKFERCVKDIKKKNRRLI